MGEEKRGIKELLELVDFAEALTVKGIVAAKDGIGLEDTKLLVDPELWAKGKAAIDNVGEVGDEVKDIDVMEAKDLVVRAFDMVMAIVEATKKVQPEVAEVKAEETAPVAAPVVAAEEKPAEAPAEEKPAEVKPEEKPAE